MRSDAPFGWSRGAVLALALVLAAGAGCTDKRCWRMGYERTGISEEQGQADLAAAMADAERRYPAPRVAPGDEAGADVANRVAYARVEAVRATMTSKGYAPVKIPVDCDTGATLGE